MEKLLASVRNKEDEEPLLLLPSTRDDPVREVQEFHHFERKTKREVSSRSKRPLRRTKRISEANNIQACHSASELVQNFSETLEIPIPRYSRVQSVPTLESSSCDSVTPASVATRSSSSKVEATENKKIFTKRRNWAWASSGKWSNFLRPWKSSESKEAEGATGGSKQPYYSGLARPFTTERVREHLELKRSVPQYFKSQESIQTTASAETRSSTPSRKSHHHGSKEGARRHPGLGGMTQVARELDKIISSGGNNSSSSRSHYSKVWTGTSLLLPKDPEEKESHRHHIPEELSDLQFNFDRLPSTVHRLERQKTVIIYGFPEVKLFPGDVDCDASSLRKLLDAMKIDSNSVDLDDYYRIGEWRLGEDRPILLKFVRMIDKRRFLSHKRYLEEQGISVKSEWVLDHTEIHPGFMNAFQREVEQDPGIDLEVVGNVMYILKGRRRVKRYCKDGFGVAWEDSTFKADNNARDL